MFLYNSIKLVFNISQIFGLIPFRFNKTKFQWESSSPLKALTILFIVINGNLLVIFLTSSEAFIVDTESEIRDNLYLVLVFLNQIKAIVLLVELFLKRDHTIQLIYLFEQLDFSFKEHLKMHLNYARIKKTSLCFFTLFIIGITALLILDSLHFIQSEDWRVLRLLLIFVFPCTLNKFCYILAMILFTLVQQCIELLDKYIKAASMQNGYYICEVSLNRLKLQPTNSKILKLSEIDANKLSIIKQLYSLIWEASIEINHLMRWTLPMGFVNDFYVLIFDSYFLALGSMSIRVNTTGFYILLITWTLNVMTNFITIANTCNQTTEAVRFFHRTNNFCGKIC